MVKADLEEFIRAELKVTDDAAVVELVDHFWGIAEHHHHSGEIDKLSARELYEAWIAEAEEHIGHLIPTKPSKPCYDCGSTIEGHHTPSCDLTVEGDILDLPEVPGTQWWDKDAPQMEEYKEG